MSKNDKAFNEHHYKISNLVGKLLTIVDACNSDKEQRAAQKTLVTSEVWSWFYQFFGESAITPETNAIPETSTEE